MDIDLSKLNYSFLTKPLLVGGRAKEYYDIRKAGNDIDLIISDSDYQNLAEQYPDNLRDEYGDLGVTVEGFEIWRTIRGFDYNFLSENAAELENVKVISLEKLLFLTALAMRIEKYLNDLYLISDRINENKGKELKLSSN